MKYASDENAKSKSLDINNESRPRESSVGSGSGTSDAKRPRRESDSRGSRDGEWSTARESRNGRANRGYGDDSRERDRSGGRGSSRDRLTHTGIHDGTLGMDITSMTYEEYLEAYHRYARRYFIAAL